MPFLPELVGQTPELEALRAQLERVLGRASEGGRLPRILIQGETGTGKGLLARAIHRASPRARGRFVAVNCAALPETLLEAELFGYQKGSFTDAHRDKPGLFQQAHGGTLFLDEVALLPLPLQAKLLTAVEDRAVRRIGATHDEPADAWLIAATHTDLRQAVREQRFREDLYHRLAVLTLTLPPLRDRTGDLLPLARHLLERVCRDYGLGARRLTAEAEAAIAGYRWPGNVRELANVLERAAVLAEAPDITPSLLELPGQGEAPAQRLGGLEDAERREVLRVLEACGGNLSAAARQLGVARNTLKARLERYGLRETGRKPPPEREATPGAPVAPPVGPLRWERRLLSYLLASAAGGAGHASASALRVASEKAEAFGGRIEERGPSSLVVVFGVASVEDATRRAALTAVAMLRAVGQGDVLSLAIHTEPGAVVRMGEATSIDAEAKHRALSVLRERLSSAAPGAVGVSRAAGSILQRHFELTPVPGGFLLRGGERAPLAVFEGATPFVGREGELALLRGRLERVQEGSGQVVAIIGHAGIGKSRLVFELRRECGDVGQWLEARCLPFESTTPLAPFAAVVRTLFGLSEEDAAPAVRDELESGCAALGLDAARVRFLGHLLGLAEPGLDALGPDALRAGTFEALLLALFAAARRRPLVLVVEDLHWADRTTAEMVERLAGQLEAHPILLITTQRQGVVAPALGRTHVAQLSLPALTRAESARVLRAAAGASVGRLEERILAKAEGNPFFLEELLRHALEQPGEDLTVPDTVQGALAARIDRLADPLRRTLQRAAVVGRDVPAELLRALGSDAESAAVAGALGELCRLEFLVERRPGELFAFRHALTHEVAYQSVPLEERQELHACVARALEASSRERLDEVADSLAHHYERSREHARAVAALVRLAERAARTDALEDALSALGRALGHTAELDESARRESLPSILFRQAHCLAMLGRFSEALERLRTSASEVEAIGTPEVLGPYDVWRAAMHSYLGQHDAARELAARGIAHAARAGDRSTEGRGHFVLAREGFFTCRFAEGVASGLRAVAALTGTKDQWWLGQSLWIIGWNHLLSGQLQEAVEAASGAARVGTTIGDVRLQAYGAWTTGFAFACGGDAERALAHCKEGAALASDPVSSAFAEATLGYAQLVAGQLEAAIGSLERGAARLRQLRLLHQEGGFRAFLAAALLERGDAWRSRQEAEAALRTCRAVGYSYGEGWALRVLGRLARAEGDAGRALELLRASLDRFATIGSWLEGARGAEELGALARELGRGEEADALDRQRAQWLQMLAPSALAGASGRVDLPELSLVEK